MKNPLIQTIAALGAVVLAGSAAADTNLLPGGDIRNDAGWDNGKPSSSNPGTAAVDGIFAGSLFGYGAGAIINHTAGEIVGTGTNGFNMNGGGTWNMSGGKIVARYVLSNGGSTIFNFSGGTVELANVTGTKHVGVGNGGTLNISGSVVIDGTHASAVVQTGGTTDIASNWTGSWTWGPYSGTEWRDHFTSGQITLDGVVIDGATFDSTFLVLDSGQTLAITAPVLPTTFNGGDLLTAGDWTNGLPVVPVEGTVAVDGTYNDGNAGTADWFINISAGTITAGQDWSFTGASKINITGGTLDVAGDILVEDTTVMTITDGMISWDGTLDTGTSIDSKIVITGGTFDGTATGTTTFGNKTGSGELVVTGGTISSSLFDFSSPTSLSTLGGSAVLDGTGATFGLLDLQTDWTGSFTVTGFSGTDWETQFTSGDITLDGFTLDAALFALNFTVTPGGQTLTYTPSTELLANGALKNPADWNNGLPNAMSPGTIAVDGTLDDWASFGAGSIVTMTGGTLTCTDAKAFNTLGGGTWNISGGTILARYFLVNAQNGAAVVNLSGGLVQLTDVEGNQDTGVANGGVLNISGSAVLDGTQASKVVETVGTIDINSNWTGTWTYGFHSGYDWENLFLAGSITLDGNVLDLAGFEANFAVTDGGQTLAIGTGGTPYQGEPTLEIIGVNEFDELVIRATNLNPSKTYDLRRGTNLVDFPDPIDALVTGVSEKDLFDDNRPADKAYYQLKEQ